MKTKIDVKLPAFHSVEYARILLCSFQSFKLMSNVSIEYGEWLLKVPAGCYGYKLKDMLSVLPAEQKCTSPYSYELVINMEYDDGLLPDVVDSQD